VCEARPADLLLAFLVPREHAEPLAPGLLAGLEERAELPVLGPPAIYAMARLEERFPWRAPRTRSAIKLEIVVHGP